MDCFGVRAFFASFLLCFGKLTTKSKANHADHGEKNAEKFAKNKVAPLPLKGTLHINTPKANEDNVLRQLEEEGVVAKRSAGGVAFDVGAKCQKFNHVGKLPRRLPALNYDSEEKELMASIMKDENLKRKGQFAKISEVRRQRATERREASHQHILERVKAKQDRFKQRMENRKSKAGTVKYNTDLRHV